jgi:NAD(P)-dependent dehydrogenase (short-subunit alcohol dehydrogenase family)
MSNHDLGGKIALITGASRGIGEAIANVLAARGGAGLRLDAASTRQASRARFQKSVQEQAGNLFIKLCARNAAGLVVP